MRDLAKTQRRLSDNIGMRTLTLACPKAILLQTLTGMTKWMGREYPSVELQSFYSPRNVPVHFIN